tara:strand:- start:1047 stop:1454 length:408 start_codon:yes stop_codon:yes gene_type:complete
MNVDDKELLTNLKIFCPPNIVTKYSHKQAAPKEWIRFYYYKNKKKKLIFPQNIEYDYEVSSTLNYNKNTFYKMTTMSNQDGYFDYYFKLKDNLPNVVIKKSNRHNKSDKTKSFLNKLKVSDYERDKHGKFILRFD